MQTKMVTGRFESIEPRVLLKFLWSSSYNPESEFRITFTIFADFLSGKSSLSEFFGTPAGSKLELQRNPKPRNTCKRALNELILVD